MTATALPIGPMASAAVDALLAESTAVAGWPRSGVLSWRTTSTTFELHSSLPSVADGQLRELLLTSGASLLNVRVLIRVLGLHPAVRLLPDPQRPGLLAIVRPQGMRVITSEDRLIAAGIVLRAAGGTTVASPADRAGEWPALPDNMLALFQRAAKVEHGWAAMIPADALPFPLEPTTAEPRTDGPVVVIGTVLDSRVARLQAGQAMQRALLTATVNGVVAGPVPTVLSQPTDRAVVRELIGGGLWPQAVLRMDPSSAA